MYIMNDPYGTFLFFIYIYYFRKRFKIYKQVTVSHYYIKKSTERDITFSCLRLNYVFITDTWLSSDYYSNTLHVYF